MNITNRGIVNTIKNGFSMRPRCKMTLKISNKMNFSCNQRKRANRGNNIKSEVNCQQINRNISRKNRRKLSQKEIIEKNVNQSLIRQLSKRCKQEKGKRICRGTPMLKNQQILKEKDFSRRKIILTQHLRVKRAQSLNCPSLMKITVSLLMMISERR